MRGLITRISAGYTPPGYAVLWVCGDRAGRARRDRPAGCVLEGL